MQTYILQRVLLAAVTLVIVALIAFSLLRIMPGSAAEMMVTEQGYAQNVEALRERLGLNDAVYVQFGHWLGDLLHGSMGESLYTGKPITEEIANRLPVSLRLGVMMLLTGWSVGVPLGVLAAVRQGTALDELSRATAVLFLALPTFWVATMFLVFPSIWFGWAPPLRYVPFTDNPIASTRHLIWPALIGGLPISAGIVRVTRTLMLEVLRQDYVRTARAKGLAQRAVLYRHCLRNAAPPLVTMMGLQLTTLVAGSVILEQIFGIPGVGRYILEAAVRRDYPVVQALLLITATLLLMTNLAVDLAYGYLDPRIRLR
jgi:peptide/nickel transport system permease protein